MKAEYEKRTIKISLRVAEQEHKILADDAYLCAVSISPLLRQKG